MYRSISDFEKNYQEETAQTRKLFSLITEDKKNIKIHENIRSLNRLAWHITQSITEMGLHAGLIDSDPMAELSSPPTIEEIIQLHEEHSGLLKKRVRLKWTDSSLEDTIEMYGEQWPKGKVLHVLIAHEAHHRSQMTVIMRMLDLPIIGIYGPSKEEWQAIGLSPME
ncbi:DinB family protein [Pedobacter antarcticus]|uniref:DinB family protein n=1 Tax=Pedobacter antarcticus TaxID=34086 RepID=UPI00292DEFB9|nr:DinB family protein [Pedobacter antarcticus]